MIKTIFTSHDIQYCKLGLAPHYSDGGCFVLGPLQPALPYCDIMIVNSGLTNLSDFHFSSFVDFLFNTILCIFFLPSTLKMRGQLSSASEALKRQMVVPGLVSAGTSTWRMLLDRSRTGFVPPETHSLLFSLLVFVCLLCTMSIYTMVQCDNGGLVKKSKKKTKHKQALGHIIIIQLSLFPFGINHVI